MSDVTRLLDAAAAGDPHAPGQLLPLVYDELRRLAAQRLAREKPGTPCSRRPWFTRRGRWRAVPAGKSACGERRAVARPEAWAMKIGIIGAGNVGGTLGRAWARKGHEVVYGVRSPQDAKTQDVVRATGPTARAGSPAEAAAFGEVVLLATPWPATESAIKSMGDLRGKVVIDATNPLKPDLSGLELGHTTSAAERVAGWAAGAKVVKAFNTVGANIMADPVIDGRPTVMFVCGDDAAAKKAVLGLAADVGFEPIDAGPLAQARLLEPWAMLWIWLAFRGDAGRDFGFARVRRK
jgi:8-hydroxy-5-deazaflavin:NADPH oxidoreductase